MSLLSVGTLVTIAGTLVMYWRVPVRFTEWWFAKEVTPAIGQRWRVANFKTSNTDWIVDEVDKEFIHLISDTEEDTFGDFLNHRFTWEEWKTWHQKNRLWCKDANQSIEDKYWGKASED